MSRWFVTGTTGFVGGHVAAQLRASGHEVVTIARDPARAGALTALGVEVNRGDVTDPASLRGPMRGSDGVYHVAGWYKLGVHDPREGERINVEGTRHVLECMRELAIPRGVYTSTLAVNGNTHGRLVDALALAERITGVPRPRLVAPPALLRVLAAVMTPLAALLPIEGDYHPETLRVLAGVTYLGSAEKAVRELGWSARPLEAGLRETLLHEMALLGMPVPAAR